MSNFIRKALSAALATAILGGAALTVAPTAASAAPDDRVLFAQSECINGFWHVRSYDITNPNNWILLTDEQTLQPCVTPVLALDLDLAARFRHAVIHDVRRDERIDVRRDERRDVRTDVRHDVHPVHIATRTDR